MPSWHAAGAARGGGGGVVSRDGISVRYWSFDGPMPEDVTEGRLDTGIAYHVERKERLVYVRVLSQDTGALAWEMWLDGDSARELGASLSTLDPWLGAGGGPKHGHNVELVEEQGGAD
jgi:hypothetical protein